MPLPRVLIDTEQDWNGYWNGYWMDVDLLTRWQIQSRGNSAASLGTGCRDSWRKHTKGYAKNIKIELKEWSIMVHVSPDENFVHMRVDTLHLEFFILSICNFGLYETPETSKRTYLIYLNPCSWLRASRIASLQALWGLNQSQTALESQRSLVD